MNALILFLGIVAYIPATCLVTQRVLEYVGDLESRPIEDQARVFGYHPIRPVEHEVITACIWLSLFVANWRLSRTHSPARRAVWLLIVPLLLTILAFFTGAIVGFPVVNLISPIPRL